jgi:hypothetical protein
MMVPPLSAEVVSEATGVKMPSPPSPKVTKLEQKTVASVVAVFARRAATVANDA